MILAAAARRLKPNGVLAFSLERGQKPPFQLTDTGRYTHSPAHVRNAAETAGLKLLDQNESFLRMEWGEEVIGLYTVLGRARAEASTSLPAGSFPDRPRRTSRRPRKRQWLRP